MTGLPSNAPENALTEIIRRQDNLPERSRIGGDRIHASSLIDADFCPRKEWLVRRSDVVLQDYAGGAMRLVWALGRAAEHHARMQLLRELRHAALGRWACHCGQTTQTGYFDPESSCSTCGSGIEHYREAVLEVGVVVGSPDFLVRGEDGRVIVVEFKSMKADDFKALTSPVAAHSRQVRFYVHMLHANGVAVHPQPRVIYLAKDFIVRQSVYKEFVLPEVNLDSPDPNTILAFAEAEEAMGELIPNMLPSCASGGPTCTKAGSCPCGARCFAIGQGGGA
jgi:hypothetical protein